MAERGINLKRLQGAQGFDHPEGQIIAEVPAGSDRRSDLAMAALDALGKDSPEIDLIAAG